MQEYSIFWVIDEIAEHYFHKSHLLFLFYRDFQSEPGREDLKTQKEYITKRFPKEILISHIKNNYQNQAKLNIKKSTIEIYKGNQYIALHINEKHLKFRCKTLQDAEELLFPALRQFQLNLFIIGENTSNYGWISPLLTTSKYQDEQVLYSYL
jgi:hypothetical protein